MTEHVWSHAQFDEMSWRDNHVHALQIEVRRGLYMDEDTLRPHAAMRDLKPILRQLLLELARVVGDSLAPRPRPGERPAAASVG